MLKSSIRVLIVDDFEPWRHLYRSLLQEASEFRIIGEASDGLQAVQLAGQLQPDLVLLDIGLPILNGVEAARQIRDVSAASKILFVSENRTADIVEEALSTDARAYIVKSDAGELLSAIRAVLEGNRFVSSSVAGYRPHRSPNQDYSAFTEPQMLPTSGHHEVGFYSQDRQLVDHVTRFTAAALNAGNAAIVIATEPHRQTVLSNLNTEGLNMAAAIAEGRYLPFDAAATLLRFMVNGMPDPIRFMELLRTIIVTSMEAAKGTRRVSIYGECVHLLCAHGNTEAAIQVEQLGNQLMKTYDFDILCGYLPSTLPGGGIDAGIFQRICAEHSAVHSL